MTTISEPSAPIWEALRGVLDPELGENVVDLGMIKDVTVTDGRARISVALTIAACPLRDQIENDVVRKVTALPAIDTVAVDIVAMTQAERTELMERVRSGVDEIRSAASEQEKGNQVVYHGSIAMREVAHQVRGTTEEQSRGSGRIRESVDGVRDAVEQINSSHQEQSAACRSVVEFLEEVSSRTQSNEVSAKRMDEATKGLVREAEGLREDVHRFRI